MLFRSNLAESLCHNASSSDHFLTTPVPIVHEAIYKPFTVVAATMLILEAALIMLLFLYYQLKAACKRRKNVRAMCILQLVGNVTYAVTYALGGGVHLPSDHLTKTAMIACIGFGSASVLSLFFWWINLERKVFGRMLEVQSEQRFTAFLLVCVGLMLTGVTHMTIVAPLSCLPFISLFRQMCVYFLTAHLLMIVSTFSNLEKTLKTLKGLAAFHQRRHSELRRKFQKARRFSRFILGQGTATLCLALIAIATPYLEDVAWFFEVCFIYMPLVVFVAGLLLIRTFLKGQHESNPQTSNKRSSSKVAADKIQQDDPVSLTGYQSNFG